MCFQKIYVETSFLFSFLNSAEKFMITVLSITRGRSLTVAVSTSDCSVLADANAEEGLFLHI